MHSDITFEKFFCLILEVNEDRRETVLKRSLMILSSFTYAVSSVLHDLRVRGRKTLWWQWWLSREGRRDMTKRKQEGRAEREGVMSKDERTEIDDVCGSEGAPAVCLSCTREDCVEPAEMTAQTRPVTRNTDAGMGKHPLKGVFSSRVCVHLLATHDSRWIDAPQQICLEERLNFCAQRFLPRAFAFLGWKCGIQQSQHPPHYTRVTFSEIYETTHTHTHTHSLILQNVLCRIFPWSSTVLL